MAQKQSQSYVNLEVLSVNSVLERGSSTSGHSDDSPVAAATSVTCLYCDNRKHSRKVCPARDIVCHSCNKRGIFPKCLANRRQIRKKTSASILAAAPSSLSNAVVKVTINGVCADALVDTGSSDSFINTEFVVKHQIPMTRAPSNVSLASKAVSSQINGYCVVYLEFQRHSYKAKLNVLKDLCADSIIGHDILNQHSSLELSFGEMRTNEFYTFRELEEAVKGLHFLEQFDFESDTDSTIDIVEQPPDLLDIVSDVEEIDENELR
uniref:Peptidase A2 domain-containing protein n=1 Tax=Rhodnius prolixus TaxID=13249 RepID=T1HE82_RHOPR